MRRHRIIPIIFHRPPAALLVASATAVYFCLSLQAWAAEPSRPAVVAEMAVTVATAQRLCFSDTLQVTGVLVPRNEILVRPDREGLQVTQVLVEAGDSVISGQVLARLTPPAGQPGNGIAVQAPAAGIIDATNAVIGMIASAGAEPLFQIAAKGEMELTGETPAKNLARLAPDQPAKVNIVGVGELSGKVRMVSTAINPITQLAQVRIFIGSDSQLRSGAFGLAKIDLGQRCGPSVPLSAVLYGSEGAVVQIVRDNRIETRRVTVGLLESGQAEIREGISAGEVVVARAGSFVREGDRVRAVTADQTKPSR